MRAQVPPSHVISVHDVSNIMRVPLLMHEQGVTNMLIKKLQLVWQIPKRLTVWGVIAQRIDNCTESITIALVGKYNGLTDSYLSVGKSLVHASVAVNRKLKIEWVSVRQSHPATPPPPHTAARSRAAAAGAARAVGRERASLLSTLPLPRRCDRSGGGSRAPQGGRGCRAGARGERAGVGRDKALRRHPAPGRLWHARCRGQGGVRQLRAFEQQAHPRHLPRLPVHDHRGTRPRHARACPRAPATHAPRRLAAHRLRLPLARQPTTHARARAAQAGRNLAGLENANSTEFDKDTANPGAPPPPPPPPPLPPLGP